MAAGQERAELNPGDWDVYPDLSFHYGLSITELRATPRPLLRVYLRALPRLKAAKMLDDITVSGFPYTVKKDRERLMSRLGRLVRIDGGDGTVTVPQTKKAMELGLLAAGIAIVHEKAS